MRRGVGVLVRRTAWLMVGAAIGLAAGLLLTGLAVVLAAPGPVAMALLLLAVLLGLVPGVRELEVTAARTMLGVNADLVVPARPRAQHRGHTVLMVTVHLVLGVAAGALLVGLVPGVVAVTISNLRGRTEDFAGFVLPPLPPLVAVLLGLLVVAAALLAVGGLGALAAGLAPRLLGPTAHDRLEVALIRLQAEAEHTRLARDLHDGIGHALTIISVQAAGGRRVLAREPAEAGDALARIEGTARQALDELDGMLGLLRDGDTGAAEVAEPGLEALPALIEAHRSAGLSVVAELDATTGLPDLVSATGYRVAAEALANAQRHAGGQPLRLRVARSTDVLSVEASNPLPAGSRPSTGRTGRGLIGLRERVAVLGGRLEAGAEQQHWVLRAEIPGGASRG